MSLAITPSIPPLIEGFTPATFAIAIVIIIASLAAGTAIEWAFRRTDRER